MRASEFSEAMTSVGAKYQDLYTQYYKRAHLAARKQGMDTAAADTYAAQALEKYKDRVRKGEWDPITNTKGVGRAEYTAEAELDEVEELDYVSKSKSRGFSGPRKLSKLRDEYDLTQKLDLGRFSIWSGSVRSESIYYIVDNQTQEAQIQLLCVEKRNVLNHLSLFAAPNNTVKAADFYRILITKLNKTLVANSQSPGSQAVWAKLNKFPDVNIHGWLNGEPVNITPDDREYAYASEKEAQGQRRGGRRNGGNPEFNDAMKMQLVAHKK